MDNLKIGLVTVLYRSDNVLEDFFRSLSLQHFKGYHLYLIDNSQENTAEPIIHELNRRYPLPGITYLKNDENYGVAKANNQGIKFSVAAGNTHTLLLNNDISFDDPCVLDKLLEPALERGENLVVPKILYHGTPKIWMAGGKISTAKGITLHTGAGEEDGQHFSTPGYTHYAPTCFMLISHTVFNRVGTMDERYFVYYDDTDFIWRALQAGFKIWYAANATISHKVNTSTGGEDSAFSIYYMERNRIYFLRKHIRLPYLIIPLLYIVLKSFQHLFRYNEVQRTALLNGLRAGFKEMAQ